MKKVLADEIEIHETNSVGDILPFLRVIFSKKLVDTKFTNAG